MLATAPEQLTPREAQTMQWEREENEAARAFGLKMKQLDIEQQQLETKWRALLRIPVTIIKLPVYVVFAFAYIVCMWRGQDPGENYWNFMR